MHVGVGETCWCSCLLEVCSASPIGDFQNWRGLQGSFQYRRFLLVVLVVSVSTSDNLWVVAMEDKKDFTH